MTGLEFRSSTRMDEQPALCTSSGRSGLIVVTLDIRNLRARLVTLAVLLNVMVMTALGVVVTITAAEWSVTLSPGRVTL